MNSKTTTSKVRDIWKPFALGLAASAAVMTGSAEAGTWAHNAWTNDATSGITGVAADYTVAVNTGTGGDAPVTVNTIPFVTHATSGTNFSMGGGFAATGRATNVTGASATLANNFLYNGAPRTVNLTNLTVGETYETSFFAYGWEAAGRVQTFASSGDTYVVDQDAFGNNNGIRIYYNFVATATNRAFTITPGAGGTFHMSALANRKLPPAADTDGDLIPDWWETQYTANLTTLGPAPADFDIDGITDAQEYVLSGSFSTISPIDDDSDDDGLKDGPEVAGAGLRPPTSPTKVDTDSDTINDLAETNSGIYISGTDTGTNPALADTDGDSFPDAYEISVLSNPSSALNRPALPVGVAVSVLTDDDSTGIINTPSELATYTHKISGGYATTVNGLAFDALTAGVTPANFEWAASGGKNVIAPLNNNDWVPATGGVTGAGLLDLLGGFTYSGGGANPGSTQSFTLSGLTPGLLYEVKLYIRLWSFTTIRPIALSFTNGAEVAAIWPGHNLREDRPGEVTGTGNPHAAYALKFTYVAQGTSLVIDANVPADALANSGSFHMYGLTNREAGPPPPLTFNSIVRATNGSSMTLDIKSRPGRTYGVYYSTDLATWIELTDSVASTGTSTIYVDTIASNFPRTFYRVDDVTP